MARTAWIIFFQNLNFRLQISDVGICQQNVESVQLELALRYAQPTWQQPVWGKTLYVLLWFRV
jgi:hypothetical protein